MICKIKITEVRINKSKNQVFLASFHFLKIFKENYQKSKIINKSKIEYDLKSFYSSYM